LKTELSETTRVRVADNATSKELVGSIDGLLRFCMPQIQAIVSRRFSWRLMIIGACISLPINLAFEGWRSYPWIAIPFTIASIAVLNPVMNKDVPSLVGVDMLSNPRTYVGAILIAGGFLSIYLTR
jgi:hypothetical protein